MRSSRTALRLSTASLTLVLTCSLRTQDRLVTYGTATQLLYVLGRLETKETHGQLASLPLNELVAVAVEHLVRRGH
jgi:hypothetical protein